MTKSNKSPESSSITNSITVFSTRLGWMAIVGSDGVLRQLAFGHQSAKDARAALDPELARDARTEDWNPGLVERLKAYAAGEVEGFPDIAVDVGPQTPFARRVTACCRSIPPGQTLSYAQVAAKAGSPGAARAVGQCMATNRIPLVIPCHRVVQSGGGLGGYSAPGGLDLKRRLLDMEAKSD
jgi:methylated-DNA-[protein]-cysteine S-methyltransferase